MTALDMPTVQRLVALTRVRRTIEDDLAKIKGEIAEVEAELRPLLVDGPLDNLKVDGATVYTQRDLTTKTLDAEACVKACIAMDYRWMLQLSPSKFKAWCKEQMHDESTGQWEIAARHKLPAWMLQVVEVNEHSSIRVKGV